MWGTSRALQMDWTALVQEPWEGPNIATTPRASWSQAAGGREGCQQSLGGAKHGAALGTAQTLLGTVPALILRNYSSDETQREDKLCHVGLDLWVEAQKNAKLL